MLRLSLAVHNQLKARDIVEQPHPQHIAKARRNPATRLQSKASSGLLRFQNKPVPRDQLLLSRHGVLVLLVGIACITLGARSMSSMPITSSADCRRYQLVF